MERALTALAQQQKTAVVVIHGMGEQRPLETLRDLVETVYRRDLTLGSLPVGPNGMLDVSIVPDISTGSGELRRITTLKDGPQKRTDFFEFYWADIMDGTPLDMVTGWIRTLLLRSPFRLPDSAKVRRAWLILWILAAIIVVAGFVAVHPDPEGLPFADALRTVGSWLAPYRPLAASILVAVAAIVLAVRIFQAHGVLRKVAILLPMALLVAGLALFFLPSETVSSLRFWATGVTAVVGWGMNALVAPYAGDVVRYVRATPGTVERRRLVRERGLALLEALHSKRLSDPSRAGDDLPLYDRIVIVGHSLGTIVGYDILQLFWEKYGPTHHQGWDPNAAGVQAALAACDFHVKAAWGKQGRAFSLAAFQAAQETLSAALAAQNPGWRITDFITLGSPLTHAEFLLVDSPEEVNDALVERRFATAPPHPDPLRDGSMLFSVTTPAPAKRPAKARRKISDPLFPHFAAQFAAVKWTNIYDESRNPLLGDLVSGRLGGSFGPGINEHNVAIRRPGLPGLLGRIFTHTQYWRWHESYEPDQAAINAGEALKVSQAQQTTQPSQQDQAALQGLLWSAVPDHIQKLRLALRLGT
jgi:hypothetical protein